MEEKRKKKKDGRRNKTTGHGEIRIFPITSNLAVFDFNLLKVKGQVSQK